MSAMPPSRVARVDVGAEQAELLRGRHRRDAPADEIAVAFEHAAHGSVGLELVDEDAHRDAGVTALAVGHVGDVLAAPETALREVVDERERLVVREMREELALEPARQIGAGLRRGDVEFRKVLLLLRHSTPFLSLRTVLRLRLARAP